MERQTAFNVYQREEMPLFKCHQHLVNQAHDSFVQPQTAHVTLARDESATQQHLRKAQGVERTIEDKAQTHLARLTARAVGDEARGNIVEYHYESARQAARRRNPEEVSIPPATIPSRTFRKFQKDDRVRFSKIQRDLEDARIAAREARNAADPATALNRGKASREFINTARATEADREKALHELLATVVIGPSNKGRHRLLAEDAGQRGQQYRGAGADLVPNPFLPMIPNDVSTPARQSPPPPYEPPLPPVIVQQEAPFSFDQWNMHGDQSGASS